MEALSYETKTWPAVYDAVLVLAFGLWRRCTLGEENTGGGYSVALLLAHNGALQSVN